MPIIVLGTCIRLNESILISNQLILLENLKGNSAKFCHAGWANFVFWVSISNLNGL